MHTRITRSVRRYFTSAALITALLLSILAMTTTPQASAAASVEQPYQDVTLADGSTVRLWNKPLDAQAKLAQKNTNMVVPVAKNTGKVGVSPNSAGGNTIESYQNFLGSQIMSRSTFNASGCWLPSICGTVEANMSGSNVGAWFGSSPSLADQIQLTSSVKVDSAAVGLTVSWPPGFSVQGSSDTASWSNTFNNQWRVDRSYGSLYATSSLWISAMHQNDSATIIIGPSAGTVYSHVDI